MRARTLPDRSSPTRNTYQSRQAKSGQSASITHQLACEAPTFIPKMANTKPASIRGSSRVSFNLVSLITKFEALDALSLPFQLPSLQPAPLQLSPQPRARGGGGSNVVGRLRRLSTIFSPPSRSGIESDDPFVSEDNPAPAREKYLSSTTAKALGSLGKEATKNSRKQQRTNNRSSFTTGGPGVRKHGTPTNSITAPYVKNDYPSNHKRSIRDMIRLYDGAASEGVLTKAKPSIGSRTPNTPTPMSKRRPIENQYCLTPSTGNSGFRVQQSYGKIPDSPSRVHQMPAKGHLLNSDLANEGAASLQSPSKSSVSSIYVSPRTYDRARYGGELKSARLKCSSCRVDGDGNCGQSSPSRLVFKGVVNREPGTGRSRNLIKKNNNAAFDRLQISNKIETLYRAKSMERRENAADAQNPNKFASSTGKGNTNTGNAPIDSELGRYLRKRSSKVIAMAKLFDNGSAPQPSVMVATPPRQKPVFSNSSPFAEQNQDASSAGVRKPPTPPPLPSYRARRRKSTVSPKTIQGSMTTYSIPDSATKIENSPLSQQKPLHEKSFAPKGRSINEKVQLFEGVRASQETVLVKKRSGFVRKLSRSLKSLFEPTSTRNDEQGRNERDLNGGQLQAIVDEAQENNKPPKLGRRSKTPIGRWNALPPAPITTRCDGALSEKGIGSPWAAEVQEMVVKEAECGLKEPKPVRVAEVKRMMLICKERFEDMMDKEKVQARRV